MTAATAAAFALAQLLAAAAFARRALLENSPDAENHQRADDHQYYSRASVHEILRFYVFYDFTIPDGFRFFESAGFRIMGC